LGRAPNKSGFTAFGSGRAMLARQIRFRIPARGVDAEFRANVHQNFLKN
jgi:hypothetical protein